MDQLASIINQLMEFLKSDTFKSITEALKNTVASIKWDEVLATLKQLFDGASGLISK